jgi:structural maintenance of chromosome 3 (chondroitin sulfate proteoglycan 6)
LIPARIETEKESEDLAAELQDLKNSLEQLQTQQVEDSRGISRQQKNTERYLSKKQVLLSRKDECNRNIRDLGVLPEEAFEKYTNEKIDRVSRLTWSSCQQLNSCSFSAF